MVRAGLGVESVSNTTGANMSAGLVAALADNPAERVVLEVDEAWLGSVLSASLGADEVVVVLLNLSRDQLDRASEVRVLAQKWRELFQPGGEGDHATVVANVSDPLVAYAVGECDRLVACWVPTPWRLDAASCPVCTRALLFDQEVLCRCHRENFGSDAWHCGCGFATPPLSAWFGSTLHTERTIYEVNCALPGEFNRANAALAALALARAGVQLATSLLNWGR
jgi:UDP-N-acetylmuramyl tripeptide synthase